MTKQLSEAEIKARQTADIQRRLGQDEPTVIYDHNGQRMIRFSSNSDADLPKHIEDAMKKKLGTPNGVISYVKESEAGQDGKQKYYFIVEDGKLKSTTDLAHDLNELTGRQIDEKKLRRPTDEHFGQVGPSSKFQTETVDTKFRSPSSVPKESDITKSIKTRS
jgi:hypothetical protein